MMTIKLLSNIFYKLTFFVLFGTIRFAYPTPSTVYGYDAQYENFALDNSLDTAVLVVAFNRPNYFKECIKAIERNPESQLLYFVFALDGGPRSTQQENIDIINQSTIKNKIILARPYNYGCPKNHIDAKRFVFDYCKFKKLIVIEDDIVITSSYFKFISNFYTWAKNSYTNIGAVQGWSFCYLPSKEKKQKTNLVQENRRYWSFVTYCIDRQTWDIIKPIQYKFESFIDKIPATEEFAKLRSKPYLPEITQWVNELAQHKCDSEPIKRQKNTLTSEFTKLFTSKFLSPKFLAAQDVMMGFSFFMNDLIKLHTVVNRAIHIGETGITSTVASFYAHNIHKITLDEFDEDKQPIKFKLIKNKLDL